jgi:hypothetical protein
MILPAVAVKLRKPHLLSTCVFRSEVEVRVARGSGCGTRLDRSVHGNFRCASPGGGIDLNHGIRQDATPLGTGMSVSCRPAWTASCWGFRGIAALSPTRRN